MKEAAAGPGRIPLKDGPSIADKSGPGGRRAKWGEQRASVRRMSFLKPLSLISRTRTETSSSSLWHRKEPLEKISKASSGRALRDSGGSRDPAESRKGIKFRSILALDYSLLMISQCLSRCLLQFLSRCPMESGQLSSSRQIACFSCPCSSWQVFSLSLLPDWHTGEREGLHLPCASGCRKEPIAVLPTAAERSECTSLPVVESHAQSLAQALSLLLLAASTSISLA